MLTAASPLTPVLTIGTGYTNQANYTISGNAEPNRQVQLHLNGTLAGTVTSDASGAFSAPLTLLAGSNDVHAVAVNGTETSLPYRTYQVVYDFTPPVITVSSPLEGGYANYAVLVGQLDEPGTLTVAGIPVPVNLDLTFHTILRHLSQGQNLVQLVATDLAGNSTTVDRTFTLDSVPPAIPDPAQITVGVPSGGSETVSAGAGIATTGDTVSFTNTRTGESVQTTVVADGSYAAQIGAQAGDTLVILLTDPAGNATATRVLSVAGTPPALGFTVTRPLDGSSVDEDHVAVAGTFEGGANIGITVNGVAARSAGSLFCTGDISLDAGVNTVDVIATQPDGSTTSQSLAITSTGPGLVSLDVDSEQGFMPLTVNFGISENIQASITTIDYDFDGDGSVDNSQTDPTATVPHTYTQAGCYTAKVTVTDSAAATYGATKTIVVSEVDEMNGYLTSIFYNMLNRLRVGNISGALTAVSPDRIDYFTNLFNNFGSDLPVFVDQIGQLGGGAIGDGIARYVLVRQVNGKPFAFYLYLVRGEDGVWRIEEM